MHSPFWALELLSRREEKSIHHHRGDPPFFLFLGLRLYGVYPSFRTYGVYPFPFFSQENGKHHSFFCSVTSGSGDRPRKEGSRGGGVYSFFPCHRVLQGAAIPHYLSCQVLQTVSASGTSSHFIPSRRAWDVTLDAYFIAEVADGRCCHPVQSRVLRKSPSPRDCRGFGTTVFQLQKFIHNKLSFPDASA